ncbi:hypothetical protein [Thiomonas sp. FB-6]|uniref:hypothetical protein n=1 Tax=Thiomonas sp. FB-6 TaxID=1158291 RepID=UPI0003A5CEC9|nr:hypothetical protein [Thiomonas sp. FB-6]
MQTPASFPGAVPDSAHPGGGAGARLPGLLALLGLLGALALAPAQAMVLGQAQGTLVLGQVPRLRIPVRMDPGLPLVSDCVRAELSDGDTPVPEQQIRVSVHDGGARGWSSIELRGTRGLRAPFVQLRLHMGCQFQRSRSYTLLVEPSSRAAQELEPAPVLAIAGAPSAKSARPSGHRAPARPREAGRQASSSHLRLDWLSRELAEQRGVAPAALAAVAPLPPVAPLPAGSEAQLMQRIDAMQQQVRELQAINAQREHELGALRGQLARSASAPVSAQASPSASPSASALASPSWHNALFAGLGALAALLLLLLWQSRRPRIESPWPAGMLAQDLSTRASTLAAAGVSAFAAPPKPAVEAMAWEPPVDEADAFARAARPATASPSPSPDSALPYDREAFQRPLSLPEHVQIDEVVDHGHLADFFIGIGDYDKAIDVMRRALGESGGMTSALPYLYLFDLYRRCGRRAEYEQLLGECAGRLNLRVLPWDEDPSQAPRDLVDYPRALALITESWNSPARLTVVERLIADDPQKRRVGFDLPAYRDLLDLYALARELQRSQQEPARQEPPRDEPARRAAPRGAEALDLTLSLAAAAAEPAERSARAPARTRSAAPVRATGLAGPEASTLPPLDFAPSTRPPQAWTH